MIDRETLVEESVQALAESALAARGYRPDMYEILEAYPGTMEKVTRTLIAIGFNYDDGGEQGELGSDLKKRVYTIEFFVFGTTNTQGRNFANVLKFSLENGAYGDGTVPLLDVSQTPPVEIDRLVVDKVHAQRLRMPDPEPWQEFAWTTTVTLEDWYNARDA